MYSPLHPIAHRILLSPAPTPFSLAGRGRAAGSIAPAAVVGTKGERWFVDVLAWQHAVQRLLEDPSTNTVVDTTLAVVDRDGQVTTGAESQSTVPNQPH